jgi:hypothetical protein
MANSEASPATAAGPCKFAQFQIVVQGSAADLSAAPGGLQPAEQHLLPWGAVTVLTGGIPSAAALLDLLLALHRANLLLLAVTPLDHAWPPGWPGARCAPDA